MPARQVHIAKAESNDRLSVALQAGLHVDWAVTVLFYAALHLVEATVAPQTHFPHHQARFLAVRTDLRLRPIRAEYRHLYELSLLARYDCRLFSTAQVQSLYATEHDAIKRHLQPLLGFVF